ncbi:MAG: hypothetical protein ACTSWN_05000 [Promethearchaeota archaeon]
MARIDDVKLKHEHIRVLVLYLSGRPSWPMPDLDLKSECRRLEGILDGIKDKVEKSRPYSVEFTGHELIMADGDVEKLYSTAKGCDAVLFFNITSGIHGFDATIDLADELEVPLLWISQPFSGHTWTNYSRLLKLGIKIDLMATSNFLELIDRLDVLYAIKALKHSKILVVNGTTGKDLMSLQSGLLTNRFKKFGVAIEILSPARLNEAYEGASQDDAVKIANAWIKDARKVVEPSEEEIIKSAKLYLAMRELMLEHGANAITVSCLHLFAKDLLPAYPCLGFKELNDTGLLGVCEGDVDSTVTQLIGLFLSGSPGFVSDPVFDTGKNQLIHAHCVSATKMGGIDSKSLPYVIRSHMEDNRGASLQVFFDAGQEITVLKLNNGTEMLYSTGVVVENIDSEIEPRGCRTKFGTRVSNLKKFLEGYRDGLHRVVFYGDFVEKLRILARFLEFDMINEN